MWDPFEEINKIKKEMDRLFGSFFEKSGKEISKISFNEPLSDIEEGKDKIIINLDMPGVDKKDMIITIKDNILDVRAEKKKESKVEKKNLYKYERSYSGFHRSLNLPEDVKESGMKTEYKNGVLKITISKKKKRLIKIR